MHRLLLILLAVGAALPASAAKTPPFKVMPLRTPEQQMMMNALGNLSVADVLYDRCGTAFDPAPGEAQKKAVLAYAGQTERGAQSALHEAYPLDPVDEFKTYTRRYKQQVAAAANAAIDRNGCEDAGVMRSIELLQQLHRQLPVAAPPPTAAPSADASPR